MDRKYVEHIAWYGGASATCQLIRFLGVIYVTPKISMECFGFLANIYLLIGLSSIVRDWGQTSAFLSSSKLCQKEASYHWIASLIGSVLSSGLFLIAVYLWPQPTPILHSGVLLGSLIIVFAEGVYTTAQISLQKNKKYRRMAFIELMAVLSWLSLIILANIIFGSLKWEYLIYARLSEALIRVLFYHFFNKNFMTINGLTFSDMQRFFYEYFKHLWSQSWKEAACSHIEILMLNIFSSIRQVGLHERSSHFMRIPISASINLVDKVATTLFADSSGDVRLARFYKVLLWVLCMSAAASICLLAIMPLIHNLFGLGETYNDIYAIVVVGVFLSVIRACVWVCGLYFLSTAQAKKLRSMTSLLLVMMLFFCALGAINNGAVGVVVGAMIAHVVTLAVGILYANQNYELQT